MSEKYHLVAKMTYDLEICQKDKHDLPPNKSTFTLK